MRWILVATMTMMVGCGGTPEEQQRQGEATPEVAACTIDGLVADSGCYAAVKGGGAVFGLALTRGAQPWTNGFLGFFFDASTISHGASTFPSANNDMTYYNAMNTCDGVGSATWASDGTNFCVTTTATCGGGAPTTHVGCVPAAMLN